MKIFRRHTTGSSARQGIASGLALLCTGSLLLLTDGRADALTRPGPPTGVAAKAGNGSITVMWSAPVDTGSSPVTSYTLTTTGPGVAGPMITGTAATIATVHGLTNGASYTVKVAATNSAGTGATSRASGAVTPQPEAPGPPRAVSAEAANSSAVVTWSPPADDGGATITSYTVTATLQGVVVNRVVLPGSSTSVIVGGLTNGSRYWFTVSATNGSGTGPSDAVGPVAPGPDLVATTPASRSGYWMLEADGHVYPFGDAPPLADPRGQVNTTHGAVDLEATPSGNGYWVVDGGGRVYPYGDAARRGNLSGLVEGERVTSLSATPSGAGYWIFTNRGRVVPYGDATFHGDMLAVALNGPVRDSIATPSGDGYYLVASDGGIFAFGDANFYGSMGATRLNAPVQSLVPDADGVGYWLVASDGGIFAFDAPFRGSMGDTPLNQPITGMVRLGTGYVMVGSDGGVFNFSDRPFLGSLGASPPARPIVSAAALDG